MNMSRLTVATGVVHDVIVLWTDYKNFALIVDYRIRNQPVVDLGG